MKKIFNSFITLVEYNFSTLILITILKLIVILVVLCVESKVFYMHSTTFFNNEFFYKPKVTAHRASAAIAPENTLAGFKESFLSGAEYIEIDIQETKDGELILLHDSNFKRTTGIDKNVWEVNYDEVKTYDAGSHFSPSFTGEKIPTLKEVIKFSKDKTKLIIEMKHDNNINSNIEEKVVNLVKTNKIENQCIIASSNKEILRRVKELDSKIVTCFMTKVTYSKFYDLDYIDIYGIESNFVNKNVVNNIHERGKQVFVWTINEQSLIKKMIDLKVDSIITDNPYMVKDIIYPQKNKFMNILANYLFP
ncbi:glycerophosphodiester phosphodiesterase [Clostridium cylindrosporum]|uniref:Glycerophosphoryl diester phosphodiesterase n=1 Tax=Clostridium cylindrosporum DSM 605 TaxID=1121307 RepID=A0A0J8DB13_CLOCY|nr:glycerophosphodiester phosphodiesterase family protein [Clostridium cylindrosporum]KMT23260.1 glycerophosphoryl diester phosphodiesterase [Clostridium cylindrosporum DSM 605]